MARKQAKRHKCRNKRQIDMLRQRWRRVLAPVLAAALLMALMLAVYRSALLALDRDIRFLEISGPLKRVSAMQIEAALADELDAGFFRADLDRMRDTLRELPWIREARVARRWSDRIAVSVTEQRAAAVWDERGLINLRGELFVAEARHLPAELPRLSGPDATATEVAQRYRRLRERLIPLGLDLGRLALSDRGAWTLTLANGIEVRLGRRDVDARTGVFLDVVTRLISAHAKRIDYVDLRYSSGFSIAWKAGSAPPDGGDRDAAMLAARGPN